MAGSAVDPLGNNIHNPWHVTVSYNSARPALNLHGSVMVRSSWEPSRSSHEQPLDALNLTHTPSHPLRAGLSDSEHVWPLWDIPGNIERALRCELNTTKRRITTRLACERDLPRGWRVGELPGVCLQGDWCPESTLTAPQNAAYRLFCYYPSSRADS